MLFDAVCCLEMFVVWCLLFAIRCLMLAVACCSWLSMSFVVWYVAFIVSGVSFAVCRDLFDVRRLLSCVVCVIVRCCALFVATLFVICCVLCVNVCC